MSDEIELFRPNLSFGKTHFSLESTNETRCKFISVDRLCSVVM